MRDGVLVAVSIFSYEVSKAIVGRWLKRRNRVQPQVVTYDAWLAEQPQWVKDKAPKGPSAP